MYFNHKNKIIIQHVPKTGGTSLLYSLRKNSSPDSKWPSPYGMHYKYSNLLNKNGDLFYELKENWTKISTVRNPWDHAVSRYFHFVDTKRIHIQRRRHTFEQLSSFEYYLENLYDPQDDWTFNCKKFMVDQWFKFETLEENWEELAEKLNFKFRELVKHNITSERENYYGYIKPQDYRDMYTNDRMIEIVSQKSQKTIEYFGYEF